MNDITKLIILVSLAAGYIAFSIGYYTRYRMVTIPWEQRLFESALLGGILFAISRVLVVTAIKVYPDLASISAVIFVKNVLPFRFSGTLIITVLLAIFLAIIVNIRIPHLKALIRANENYGSALRYEIFKSFEELVPLLVTLNNEKVICGWVVRGPAFEKEKSFVIMLPLLEGYDSKEEGIIFTKTYYEVYEKFHEKPGIEVDVNKHEITLALENIASARRFDLALYAEFDEKVRANKQ